MLAFRNSTWRKALSLCLIAAFMGSQLLACCLVNREVARFLLSWLPNQSQGAQAANQSGADSHACCHKSSQASAMPVSATPGRTASDAAPCKPSADKGCCIQDANRNTPVLVSESLPVPDLSALIGFIPAPALAAASLPAAPSGQPSQFASGPPIYLAQLRLLI